MSRVVLRSRRFIRKTHYILINEAISLRGHHPRHSPDKRSPRRWPDLRQRYSLTYPVSRIDATSELKQLEMVFDINSEIYPLEKSRVRIL